MQRYSLTPEQKSKIAGKKDRRRRERERREHEYWRRIEEVRRRIGEARKRRQRLLLVLLLVLLATLESMRPRFSISMSWPEPAPDPTNWTPNPVNDFAPRPGHDDYCDGYSREQWLRMTAERGIGFSRKAALKAQWDADPDRAHFPARYKAWAYRPHLGELMYDLTAPYWQADAFEAIKLMSPVEVHRYLNEAYATDPGDLLMCRADLSADIITNFQSAAIRWEVRKQREVEEARREKELSQENDGGKGGTARPL